MTTHFTVAEIRKSFLDFFASKGHTVVASSPLVPGNDPTLMFTNSGMVQFKDVFLGTDKRSYVRAASVQACLRAGGKHNDLENVGYTARHHTFFEMLGNWSFGDYFKRESLKWAWELLTEVYKLPKERLLATVYAEDDEAYDIWTKEIGLPADRVIRIGDNKGGRYKSDNFWMMADTGPCGPCSEIFYDHGDHIPGGPPGSPEEDGDRFIEIWNNVFMQFEMHEDGSVTPLPAPCVDTGMGLERLAAILQGVHSNYEIDIFDRLIKAAARETAHGDLSNPSLKVIADHIRATSFLISDGVIPSNEGRGYVQRRIIRRAIRHGYKLGQKTPFFHKLVPDLVALMGDAYPNLAANAQRIADVLQAEEERFYETLANGMEILDVAIQQIELESAQKEIEQNLAAKSVSPPKSEWRVLSGEVAFKLHDTYGFPLDLSADVCRERGLSVDEAGFNAAMERQKAQARAAGKFKMDKALDYSGAGNTFVGYEQLQQTAKVLAVYVDGTSVEAIKHGQNGVVVLDTTPFYAESGGQVGDCGVIRAGSACFDVADTQKIKADVFGHHGTLTEGTLAVGDTVTALVDTAARAATARNHSVTHLMHKALREVLGSHVQQKGSLVDPEKTRFDFVHNAPMTDGQIREVERLVNAEILANAATQARVMDIEGAKATGAMMLFGEKYGDSVRVLDIGSSRELCGGTHVQRTGDIGAFSITAEGGVAAGVRRVEAVTGDNALALVQQQQALIGEAAAALKAQPQELVAKVAQVL
ncbi:MAG TPA: alanine--tRNA ligase, partial [Burkholderiaceae bacterium]|nr:alanine--tRNA ligase [Burkholderiaceae bacterium]